MGSGSETFMPRNALPGSVATTKGADGHVDAVIDHAAPADARAILDLVVGAGWAYGLADIDRLIRLDQEGMLVALAKGGGSGGGEGGGGSGGGGRSVIGCVYASKWGHLGFIGLLLVRPDLRGRGLGERLVRRGVSDLQARGAASVGLDAVHEAVSLYERLGFTPTWESLRLAVDTTIDDRPATASRAREAARADMDDVLGLDRRGWGADRGRILASLGGMGGMDGDGRIIVAPDEGPVRAYAAMRRGPRNWRLGPWVAEPTDEGSDAARAVLAWAMDAAAGEPIGLGVPDYSRTAVETLNRLYAIRYRSCTRMYLGDPGPALGAVGSWAIGAPEKG